jgi:hypothetical protein
MVTIETKSLTYNYFTTLEVPIYMFVNLLAKLLYMMFTRIFLLIKKKENAVIYDVSSP